MKSIHLGDVVIVEDPPTGVAMHAEGTITGIDGDTAVVLIDGEEFVINIHDLSVKSP